MSEDRRRLIEEWRSGVAPPIPDPPGRETQPWDADLRVETRRLLESMFQLVVLSSMAVVQFTLLGAPWIVNGRRASGWDMIDRSLDGSVWVVLSLAALLAATFAGAVAVWRSDWRLWLVTAVLFGGRAGLIGASVASERTRFYYETEWGVGVSAWTAILTSIVALGIAVKAWSADL